MGKRDYSFDIAKGIGIVLVVYGHVIRGLNGTSVALNDVFYSISDKLIYSFHMPLFFIISGYLFKLSSEKYANERLIRSKVTTILYPYFIWSVLQSLLEIILSKYTNGDVGWMDLVLIPIIPRAQFWFLFVLFIVMLVHILIKKWYWVGLSISLIYIVLKDVGIVNYPRPFDEILYFYFFFVIGFKFLPQYLNLIKGMNTILVLGAFGLMQFVYLYFEVPILKVVCGLLGFIALINLSVVICERNSLKKVFVLLGEYSMEIYILHIIISSGLRIILMKFLHIDNVILHIIIGTALGIIAPIFFMKLFPKAKKLFALSV